jgi:imidazolonepropionase-like amidohydrolase
MLLRGFTTVRDTGGASKRIALAIEEGLIQGPRLIQCGKALSQTGLKNKSPKSCALLTQLY